MRNYLIVLCFTLLFFPGIAYEQNITINRDGFIFPEKLNVMNYRTASGVKGVDGKISTKYSTKKEIIKGKEVEVDDYSGPLAQFDTFDYICGVVFAEIGLAMKSGVVQEEAVDGTNYRVFLQGGKIGMLGVGRLEVLVESKSRMIRWMKGFGPDGAVLLDGSLTYDEHDPPTLKQMKMTLGDGGMKTETTTETLINDMNLKLSEDLFSVVQP